MSKIGNIYVEVRGDYSKWKEDMNLLRAEVRKSGTEISDALNNAISPKQAQKGIQDLVQNLHQLSAAAKVPAENFRITAGAIAAGLTDVAKKAGLTEQEFAKLNERMLRTTAQQNMVKSLEAIGKACNLSADEMQKLGKQMGMSSDQLKSLHGNMEKSPPLLDRIKSNWVALSAAVVGAYMAIGRAVALMDVGAKAMQIESSFKIMAESAGVNSAKMIESLKRATKETIDDSDMMQKSIKLMTLGYDPSQIERFSKVVITASQIAGTTAAEAFDQLGDAIANRMPKALVRMGAVTREQMKIVTEAIESGADSTVLYELAIANLESKQRMLQGTQDEATLSLQKFHAQVSQTKEEIGMGLIVAAQKLYGVFQGLGAISLAVSSGIYKIIAARNDFAAMVHFGEAAKQFEDQAKAFRKMAEEDSKAADALHKKALENIWGTADAQAKASEKEKADGKEKVDLLMKQLAAYKATAENAKKLAQEREAAEKEIIGVLRKAELEIEQIGMDAYDKEVARIEAQKNKWIEAGASRVEIEKATQKQLEVLRAGRVDKSAQELKESEAKAMEENYQNWLKMEEQRAKKQAEIADQYTKNREAMDESEEKAILESYEVWLKVQEATRGAIGKSTLERIKLESDMYKDLDKSSTEHYEAQIKLIDSRAKAARDAGVDEVVIAKWVEQEKAKAWDDSRIAGEDFWAGLAAARDKYYREETKMGQMGADIFRDYIAERNQAVSGFVDNFIAGQDLMVSAQKAAGDMMTNLAGDISKRMWAAGIDKIVQYIGAKIGQGTAEVGASGAAAGGVPGALSQIALYLGTAVAAMLAGRGMAKAFKAEGGWISQHPGGGWINQGSGSYDDVFLGNTGNVRHWGMGGEFVVNKDASAKYAPLLEALNKRHGDGGPIGSQADWTGIADALVLGSGGSFVHGFSRGGIWGAIAEAIAFNATAIPTMFASKYAGNKFMSEGGWVDVGHGFFDMFKLPKLPFMPSFNIPGLPNILQPSNVLDPEKGKAMLLDIVRAPYEQVAKDLLTPGKYFSEPLSVLGNNLSNLGRITKEYFIPKFHEGTSYVPESGLAYLEKGERVVAKGDNVPIQINLKLDGKVLSSFIYDQTKAGKKMVHPRGMATA